MASNSGSPSNKTVVLVTGCTKGGIGYALCQELLGRGCTVYATARRLEAMEGLQEAGAHLVQLQVTDKENCSQVIDRIVQEAGKIDVLINNAGTGALGPILEFDVDQAAETLAPLRLAQLVATKTMIPRRSGLIVNIGSIVGEIPTLWAGIYCASKAALHSITRVLEMEVKPFGVEVMLVAAGGVKSGFGNAHLVSYKVEEGKSLYTNVKDYILARATAGQDTSIPSAVFAKRLVDQVLKVPATRPLYFTTGGRASMFAFFRWMPWWFTRYFLMRLGGAAKIGK